MAIWITISLLAVVLVGFFTFLYLKIRKWSSFWAEKGVPFAKPHLLFGSFKSSITKEITMAYDLVKLYNSFKGKRFGGVWLMFEPTLLAVDVDLISDLLIKDFGSWPYRGVTINEDIDPLSTHLAFIDGKKWKSVRTKLTPTFTSAKLKQMHHLLQECAKDFTKYLDAVVEKGEPVDAMDMAPKFTIDVIGSCAFGIQMNALKDADTPFRAAGKELTTPTTGKHLTQFVQYGFPWLFKFLKLSTVPPKVTKFFLNVTKETIEYREKNNVRRHDLIDLLRDLKSEGKPLAEDEVEFDDKLIAAQAFVFFGAGFETSSKTISFCLHELAVNPDIQDRVRKEIQETKAASNGEFTWDVLRDMKYLTMTIQETLRKYPIAPQTHRVSAKPYIIPGTKVELPAGIRCIIPIYAVHHDPEYYPEPEKFIPERFTEEEKRKRPAMSYLPFGAGPRNCIGSRFADQETKMALATILDKFKVSLCEKSQNPVRFATNSIQQLLSPERGIWLKISRL